jgi:hypothetical protein
MNKSILEDLEILNQFLRLRAEDYISGGTWSDKGERAIEIRKAQADMINDCVIAINMVIKNNSK